MHGVSSPRSWIRCCLGGFGADDDDPSGWCLDECIERLAERSMPGLTFLFHPGGKIEDPLIARICGSDGEEWGPAAYSTSILWRESDALLLCSAYPEYPIAVHQTAEFRMCLEGRVYQSSETPWHAPLAAIAADILSGESHARMRAERRLTQLDGEFVVVFQDRRSDNVVVFGDCLGRLPVYVYQTDRVLIVSRNLSFIRRVTERIEIDRLAIAEHLLYGYPLGSRTLFKGVERLGPGSVIAIKHKSGRVELCKVSVPTVAAKSDMSEQELREVARQLSSAFKHACAVRVDLKGSTVVSLSGGLDSRCVAAAASSIDSIPLVAVTLSSGPGDREARLAAAVASVLRLNWRTLPIPRPTGADLLRLLRMKSGMNYLAMAFILPVFEFIQSEFGRGMTFFTGDGGDKLLPGHRPDSRITTARDLAQYIQTGQEVLPLPTVAAVTGVPIAEMLTALEERIASYPESAVDEKYTHFLVFERAFKWLFEGEDRNRHYFWSDTPFYARAPFAQAMSCPPRLKANYALYRLFMESLSPALLDVESTTCGPSLDFDRYPVKQLARGIRSWARQAAPSSIRRKLKSWRRQPVTGPVRACIREQLAGISPAAAYLSPPAVEAVLDRLDPTQAYTLFTVTSAVEYAASGRSILEKYRETVF